MSVNIQKFDADICDLFSNFRTYEVPVKEFTEKELQLFESGKAKK